MTTRTDLTRHADSSNGDARQRLEHEADRIRTRLLTTLDQLNQRRHEVTDVKLQAKRHVGGLVLIGGGVLLLGVGVAVASWRIAHARAAAYAPSFWTRARRNAALRAWRHPDRVANPNETSFGGIIRKVLLGAITFTLTELAKRNIRRAITPHETIPYTTR